MDVLDALAAAIARHDLIPPGARVLVGLSGGADSCALLLGLQRLGHDVVAAHLDHAARPGSAEDAAAIAPLCAAAGIPLVSERRPVPAGAHFEDRARAARYAFLAEAARAHGCAIVAVGHHQDDQAETLLFRLARGTGPAGAAGMAARRPLSEDLTLIRPLLEVPATALRVALGAWGIAWRDDPSNRALDAARNRVRHEVLPAMDGVHPGARAHLAHFAALIAEEEATWAEPIARLGGLLGGVVAPGVGELDRQAFLRLPAALRRRLVRWLAAELGATPPGAQALARALDVADTRRAADLGDGWRAAADKHWLVLTRPDEGPQAIQVTMPTLDLQPLDQPTLAWGWRVTLARAGAATGDQGPSCRWRGALAPGWVWRSARPATDRFTPAGHARERPLNAWLARQGVPRHRRPSLLVLAEGDVVKWVVGYAHEAPSPAPSSAAGGWEMQATARFRF